MADIVPFPFTAPKLSLQGQTELGPQGAQNFTAVVQALTFSVERISNTLVRATFIRPLRTLAATTVPSNYTISGPSAITVGSITFTPNTAIVDLNVTGTWVTGIYTLTLAANTAQAYADPGFNTTAPISFQVFITAGTAAAGAKFNTGFN